jgi:hypothetical protein
VRVPDCDPLSATDRQEPTEHNQIERTPIGDRDDWRAKRFGSRLNRRESWIVRRMHEGAEHPVTRWVEKSRGIQDRLVGPTAFSCHDAGVENRHGL